MADIGQRIYERRKELRLTLEEVGEAVGVGKSTVQRWESGLIKSMGSDKVGKLATVLRMDPIELVSGKPSAESRTEEQTDTRAEAAGRPYATDAAPEQSGAGVPETSKLTKLLLAITELSVTDPEGATIVLKELINNGVI